MARGVMCGVGILIPCAWVMIKIERDVSGAPRDKRGGGPAGRGPVAGGWTQLPDLPAETLSSPLARGTRADSCAARHFAGPNRDSRSVPASRASTVPGRQSPAGRGRPDRERAARARHERGLEGADHQLAVGVRGPQPAAASRGSRDLISRSCHDGTPTTICQSGCVAAQVRPSAGILRLRPCRPRPVPATLWRLRRRKYLKAGHDFPRNRHKVRTTRLTSS
jgi:hypothetical protein